MSELADSTLLTDFTSGGFRLTDEAIDIAHRMRALMLSDLDEFDMADRVAAMNEELNRDAPTFHDAWGVLNSGERRVWKQLLTLRKDHEREHAGY
jgi:hypothetical protein